jgi:hypothetical protein
VDNNPGAAETAQTKRDTSTLVVAHEGHDETFDSLAISRRFLAWNRGSEHLHFAESDLLAFLVTGQMMIEGPVGAVPAPNCATPSDQEVNAVFVVGGEPGTLDVRRANVFGSLIAREIVLEEADGEVPSRSV